MMIQMVRRFLRRRIPDPDVGRRAPTFP